jgi:hypothetical protein
MIDMPPINRPRMVTCVLKMCGAMLLLPFPAAADISVTDIRVVGTSLQARLSDGRRLTGADLTGAVMTIADRHGRQILVRINGAQVDPLDRKRARWLYGLSEYDPVNDTWHDYCHPDSEGRSLAFPLSGTTTDDGGFQLSSENVSFSCTSGALAKCIRMGYEPWAFTHKGAPLLDTFRSCIRMVRADYCGDGRSHTRDGTLIDVYDRFGIQLRVPAPDLTFEAAWAPDGAVCVRKTRIGEIWTLEDLKATCPDRMPGRIGFGCNRANAMSNPAALIFNDSR